MRRSGVRFLFPAPQDSSKKPSPRDWAFCFSVVGFQRDSRFNRRHNDDDAPLSAKSSRSHRAVTPRLRATRHLQRSRAQPAACRRPRPLLRRRREPRDPAGALDSDLTSFPVHSVFHGELSEGRRLPSSAPVSALPLSTAPCAADSRFNDSRRHDRGERQTNGSCRHHPGRAARQRVRRNDSQPEAAVPREVYRTSRFSRRKSISARSLNGICARLAVYEKTPESSGTTHPARGPAAVFELLASRRHRSRGGDRRPAPLPAPSCADRW